MENIIPILLFSGAVLILIGKMYFSFKEFLYENYFEKISIDQTENIIKNYKNNKNLLLEYYKNNENQLIYNDYTIKYYLSEDSDLRVVIRHPKLRNIYEGIIDEEKITYFFLAEEQLILNDKDEQNEILTEFKEIILGAYLKIFEKSKDQFDLKQKNFTKIVLKNKKRTKTKEEKANKQEIKIKNTLKIDDLKAKISSLNIQNQKVNAEIRKILKILNEIDNLKSIDIEGFREIEDNIINKKGKDLIELITKYNKILNFNIEDLNQKDNILLIENTIIKLLQSIEKDTNDFKNNYIEETSINAKVIMEVI